MTLLLRHRIGCSAVCFLITASLGACAAGVVTKRSHEFDASALDRIVVALTLAGGSDVGDLRSEAQLPLQEAVRDRALLTLPRYAAEFGTDLDVAPDSGRSETERREAIDAYEEVLVAAKDAELAMRPLDVVVPPELTDLSGVVEARYLLVLRGVGYRSGGFARAVASRHSGIGLEGLLIDAATSRVLWFGQHYADMDPTEAEEIEAVTAALAFELFTGRRVSAFSFIAWPEGEEVDIWPHEGKRLSGEFIRLDGLDIVVRREAGTEERIPLASISVVRTRAGERVFPSLKESSRHIRVF